MKRPYKKEGLPNPPLDNYQKTGFRAIAPEMPAQALLKPRSSPCSSPLGRGVALSENVGPSTPYILGPGAPKALLDELGLKRRARAASCCCPDNDVLSRRCSAMFALSSSWWCRVAARRFGFKAHLSVQSKPNLPTMAYWRLLVQSLLCSAAPWPAAPHRAPHAL